MRYTTLGRTGLKISRLSFGAGQLRILGREQAVELLAHALEAGINHIDIDKLNDESLVRDAVLRSKRQAILSMKSFAQTATDLRRDIEGSLSVHGADSMDICFMHAVIDRADLKQRLKAPLEALKAARKQGLVKNIGITSNRIEILKEAIGTGEFDVCCAPYSIAHQHAEKLFGTLRDQGIGLITFMTFGGGVLLDPAPGTEEPKLSFREPLRFVLSRKEIDSVIIGTNKLPHLQQLLSYAEGLLRDSHGIQMGEEWIGRTIGNIASVLGEKFCTGCKCCIDDRAKEKLEIDRILRLKAYAGGYGRLEFAMEQYRKISPEKPGEAFKEAASRGGVCPYGLDIEHELIEAHNLLMEPEVKLTTTRVESRILGRTGLKVSMIGFGGGAFNKDISEKHIWRVVASGISRGVNFLETAQDYGEAKFALAIGKAREAGHELVISSKSVASNYTDMKDAIKGSLKELKTGHIHIYQLQTLMSPEDFQKRVKGGALKALKEAMKAGRISAIGASSHRIPALLAAIESGDIDVVEVPYSIGQGESEKVLRAAERHNVGVIAIMALGGGILVDRDKKSPLAADMTAENALRFVLSDRRVHTALVGMGSEQHVEENTAAVIGKPLLSRKERGALEKKVLRLLGKDFCRSCKACMPCDVFGWSFSIDNFLRFQIFADTYGYKKFGKEYQQLVLHADACTGCGKCDALCPYGVPIIARLKSLHEEHGTGILTDRTGLPANILNCAEDHLKREMKRFSDSRDFAGGIEYVKGQLELFPGLPMLRERLGQFEMDHLKKELQEFRGKRRFKEGIAFIEGQFELFPGNQLLLSTLEEFQIEHLKRELMGFRKGRRFKQGIAFIDEQLELLLGNQLLLSTREEFQDEYLKRELMRFRDRRRFEAGLGFIEEQLECFPAHPLLLEAQDEFRDEYLKRELMRFRDRRRFEAGLGFIEEQLKRFPAHQLLLEAREEFRIEMLKEEIAVFHEKKDPKGGLTHVRQRMGSFPDHPVLLKALAEFQSWLGNHEEAAEAFKRLSPDEVDDYYFKLGRSYFETGQYKKALKCFGKYEEVEEEKKGSSDKNRFHSWYFMAICHRKLRQYEKMKSCLTKAEEFTHLFGKSERWEEKELKEFVERWPAPFFFEEFRHLKKHKLYRKGIEFGKEQLEEYPNHPLLYHHLGEFHMELGEYKEAIECLTKAVGLDPKLEWTWFSLGKCYFLTGRYEDAEAVLLNNLRLTTDRLSHYHTWLFLAMTADAINDHKERDRFVTSLKRYQDLLGKEIPMEREFLTRLSKEDDLPRWLKKHLEVAE